MPMFTILRGVAQVVIPIFVISTMLNVGLTQKVSSILGYLRDWPFVLKMLLANFVLAPLFMILMLALTSFDPALKEGLLLYGLCAGAPFLIKLTQTARHDLALGAAVMLLLMVGTVVYVPIVLPLITIGISVNGWAIAQSLLLQLLLPIAIGMLAAQFLPQVAKAVQPWIGMLGNIALYVVIGATLIGYFPNMLDIVGHGAILVGLVFLVGAFSLGYLLGGVQDHHQDVGALATAQRNTAAGLIIASQDFTNPNVLVMLTLANTLGLVILLVLAKALSRDNPMHTAPV
jgi:bile acid:Na+ symporter, BASS family